MDAKSGDGLRLYEELADWFQLLTDIRLDGDLACAWRPGDACDGDSDSTRNRVDSSSTRRIIPAG